MNFIYNIVKCIKCYTILVYHKFFSKIYNLFGEIQLWKRYICFVLLWEYIFIINCNENYNNWSLQWNNKCTMKYFLNEKEYKKSFRSPRISECIKLKNKFISYLTYDQTTIL